MSIGTPVLAVYTFALITALATGLGAIPLAFSRFAPRHWLEYGDVMAAGLMLAASFNLIFEEINFRTGRRSHELNRFFQNDSRLS